MSVAQPRNVEKSKIRDKNFAAFEKHITRLEIFVNNLFDMEITHSLFSIYISS